MSARVVMLFALSLSCDSAIATGPAADGVGPDPAVVSRCLGCHASDVGDAWKNASSHAILFDCDGCHHVGSDIPHSSPPPLPKCSDCHSNATHQGADCIGCHDPHGSTNAFLVRASIALPDGGSAPIHFTAIEGASPDGLAHGDGTGVCEVCHTSTAHFTADGDAGTHHTEWCATCHLHAVGFAAPDAGAD